MIKTMVFLATTMVTVGECKKGEFSTYWWLSAILKKDIAPETIGLRKLVLLEGA
jgi:hypothetical protein